MNRTNVAHYIKKTFKSQRIKQMSSYLTQKEKKDVIKHLGDSAYILLEHYYQAGSASDVLDDNKVGNILGWKKSKVARYRRVLVEEKYIHFVTTRSEEGDVVVFSWRGKSDIRKRLSDVEHMDTMDEHKQSSKEEPTVEKTDEEIEAELDNIFEEE